MGLIRATVGAIGSTLRDQWKEVIACEDMGNDILMVMRTTKDGTISKNSIVRVTTGQCAAIYQNGAVLDAVAEPGDYQFDASTTPSFFAGQFKEVFKEMWTRFTYGGDIKNSQVVFFFNTKEIIDNKFGTPTPVMYPDYSHPVPNNMTGTVDPLPVNVRAHGNYTFKLTDPASFMKEIAGTAEIYKKENLNTQMKSEVIDVFETVLNELSDEKYPVMNLPKAKDTIRTLLKEKNYDEAIQRRGISITGITIEGITLDEESEKYIKDYVLSSNANMQQGTLVGAYAQAVKDAANNANGATTGFMGVGMANMAGTGIMNGVANAMNQTSNVAPQSTVTADTWECPNCKKNVSGNFCADCGSKKPEKAFCPECGKPVEKNSKFCPNCGKKLSE